MIPPLIWLFYRHAVMKIPGGEPVSKIWLMISIHILCILRVVTSSLGHHFRFLRDLRLSASASKETYIDEVSRADPIDHCGGHITNYE